MLPSTVFDKVIRMNSAISVIFRIHYLFYFQKTRKMAKCAGMSRAKDKFDTIRADFCTLLHFLYLRLRIPIFRRDLLTCPMFNKEEHRLKNVITLDCEHL